VISVGDTLHCWLKEIRTAFIGMTIVAFLSLVSCMGGNPYLDTSLEPAKARGETQAWFEEEWGMPSSKASRWFGGEIWTYTRIAGGKRTFLGNFDPHTCTITLKFDDERKLTSYKYSGC